MTPKTIKLSIRSRVDNIYLVWKAMRALCSTVVEDEVVLYNLSLCVTEAVTNVIHHTFNYNQRNFIDIICTISNEKIVFRIEDAGNEHSIYEYNPSFNPNDIESISESGYGVFLIHLIMDEVISKRKNGKNILILKKKIHRNSLQFS